MPAIVDADFRIGLSLVLLGIAFLLVSIEAGINHLVQPGSANSFLALYVEPLVGFAGLLIAMIGCAIMAGVSPRRR